MQTQKTTTTTTGMPMGGYTGTTMGTQGTMMGTTGGMGTGTTPGFMTTGTRIKVDPNEANNVLKCMNTLMDCFAACTMCADRSVEEGMDCWALCRVCADMTSCCSKMMSTSMMMMDKSLCMEMMRLTMRTAETCYMMCSKMDSPHCKNCADCCKKVTDMLGPMLNMPR